MGQGADPMRSSGAATAAPGGDETEQIEQEIEQTRAEMTATIDAIQQKLDPDQAKDSARELAEQVLQEAKAHAREIVQEAGEHAREVVRDATSHVGQAIRGATIGKVEQMAHTAHSRANEASEGLLATIRQNPVPAALAGLGILWLWMNRQGAQPQRSSYLGDGARYSSSSGNQSAIPDYWQRENAQAGQGYRQQQPESGMVGRVGEGIGAAASQVGERASGLVGTVGDTAGNIAGTVGETAGNVAGAVGETASNLASAAGETASALASQAQYGAQRLEDRFQSSLQSNPLAVGAVALALGAAVGLALPQTERENALMGEARDMIVERAQGMAQETIGKVQQVASEVGSTVQETVKQEAQAQGLMGGGAGAHSN